MLNKFFRPNLIVGTLPVTLTNGTTADATQVMSDLNWIVNQINANAAPLNNPTFTGILNAAVGNFTNITASGTLAVTGTSTLAAVNESGSLNINSGKFTVDAATGNVISAGSANAVNWNTFASFVSMASGAGAATLIDIGANAGRYEFHAFIGNANANYDSVATVRSTGAGDPTMVATNGSGLTLSISGTLVQAAHTFGSTQNVNFSYIRIR